MLKVNIIIGFLLYCFTSVAQNLVPNYSFENYSVCPTTSNQLSYATPWVNPTTSGSPDYFNKCSSTGLNFINVNQQPQTGNGYAGFATFEETVANVREYIQVQTTSNLSIGKCYYISFYISFYEKCKYGTNNIGCYLSNNAINLTGPSYLLNYNPQVTKLQNPVITDSLNWISVESIFTSAGGENYLTIGNFKNDANTDTILVNPSAPSTGSYYFIDDISIIPIDSLPGGMSANAGSDKNIAAGDSVFIGQEISNLNCNWYVLGGSQIVTNISGVYVQPPSTTTYVVEQNLCGNVTYDTVVVNVSPIGVEDHELFKSSIKIFPNPNDGNFTVQFESNDNFEIRVEDVLGNEVCKENMLINENLANFSLNVITGVYFAEIVNLRTGKKNIQKLIIQK